MTTNPDPGSVPSRRRRPNRRWPWVWVGLGVGLLLLGLAAGGLTTGFDGSGMMGNSLEQRQTYHGTFTALEVTAGSGDVRVAGAAPAGTVEVTRHLQWSGMAAQPTSEETVRGSTLEIVAQCSGWFMGSCSVSYVIRVPDGTRVGVEVGSGNILVDGSLGPVAGTTGSGNIDSSTLAADAVQLRTGSGNIGVTFESAPSNVALRTGSGNVRMFVPAGEAYAADVTTGSGNRDVTVDTSQTSSRKVRIETGSGNVELAYR